MSKYFGYEHIVGLEETNLVGNVYFTHFMRWQGQCREMFLRQHAPEILAELSRGLKIFTVACSCEYLAEVTAFEELSIRMSLEELTQSQIAFSFDYVRLPSEQRVAVGRQRVVCMRGNGDAAAPARVPEVLRTALAPYASGTA
jgi:enediyne biosynthesis thioesterase